MCIARRRQRSSTSCITTARRATHSTEPRWAGVCPPALTLRAEPAHDCAHGAARSYALGSAKAQHDHVHGQSGGTDADASVGASSVAAAGEGAPTMVDTGGGGDAAEVRHAECRRAGSSPSCSLPGACRLRAHHLLRSRSSAAHRLSAPQVREQLAQLMRVVLGLDLRLRALEQQPQPSADDSVDAAASSRKRAR